MVAAVKAALKDTSIPNSTIIRDSEGNPVDFDLSSDPYDVSECIILLLYC
eukprot:m.150172 g.150172  ORF g.150172 m.150172 type:complete len:50 (+) comp13280_c0_seq7:773-922(+)